MNIAIDFDGVIHDPTNVSPGYKMGKPIVGAKQALERLQEAGYRVIVFTHRATVDSQHVKDWLDYFAIPFDEVTAMKPDAEYYIDDRGIEFHSWEGTLPIILDHA